jgi:hypothetical protein
MSRYFLNNFSTALDRDVAIFSQQFLNGARLVRKTHRRLKGSPSSSEIAQMFVVTAKVMDAGRELAEANYSLGSLLGWQLCVSQRTYAITCNIRIAPTMTEL